MRTYLLVFDDGNGAEIDLRGFVEALDADAKILTLDGHVCFLKSGLSASQLADKFLKFAGSSLYFLTEIGPSNYSGRMVGTFWDFLKQPALEPAAE